MWLGLVKPANRRSCKETFLKQKHERTFPFWPILLFILLALKTVSSFNILDLSKSLDFAPDRPNSRRGIDFGYSVLVHSNSEGQWLVIGAPKDFVNKGKDTNLAKSKELQDGSMYACKMESSAKKMPKKGMCNPIVINATARNQKIQYSCDFENCDLNQSDTDDFSWIKQNKNTDTSDTGPSFDHTFQDSSLNDSIGFYYYIETSRQGRQRQVGESAMVSTPVFQGTAGSCVRFWYHMYGSSIGSLNVYMYTNHSGLMIIWNKNGNKGNQWLPAYVTVVTEHAYKIVFEGTKDSSWYGDIAIDDIVITYGQCTEDIEKVGQSIGGSIALNPDTGQFLTCAPNWKHNCSGNIQVSGLCYLLDKSLQPGSMSILSPSLKQVCNAAQIDLIFMIDESNSVGDADYTNVKYWLRNIISSLPVGASYTQVGVAVYNENPRIIFHMNDFHRVEDIRHALDQAVHKGGDTAIGKAIDYLTDTMFSVEHGMRPNAKRVAVMVTDGKSRDSIGASAAKAKAKGISLFVIGVGDVSMPHLRLIASSPEQVYHEQDYSALESIRSQLTESIAALESQGKAYTTEQSQSGFSSCFVGDTLVLGAPGLNDWSGGFSIYLKKRPPGTGYAFPETTSFQQLLVSAYGRQSQVNLSYTPDGPIRTSHADQLVVPTAAANAPERVIPTKVSNQSDEYISNNDTQGGMESTTSFNQSVARTGLNSSVRVAPTSTALRNTRSVTGHHMTSGYDVPTQHVDRVFPTAHSMSRRPEANNPTDTFHVNANPSPTSASYLNHTLTMEESSGATQQITRSRGHSSSHATWSQTAESARVTSSSVRRKDFLSPGKQSSPTDASFSDQFELSHFSGDYAVASTFLSPNATAEAPAASNTPTTKIDVTEMATHSHASQLPPVLSSSTDVYQSATGHTKALRKRDVMSQSPSKQQSLPPTPLVRMYDDDAVLEMLENAYFGYAIASGILVERDHMELVVGAPRMLSTGSVFVIRINNFTAKYDTTMVIREHRGKQMGSYFGHSLCATDTNGDGIDELFVGAPLWTEEHIDEGRVFAYISAVDQDGQPIEPTELILSGEHDHEDGPRFGFAIAAPGDLNKDGYNDLIVGAPSTADGDGAVLVFNGQPDVGIILKPSQIIRASQKKNRPIFFGFSLSTGFDVDGNGYGDIAVGAPGNDRAFVLFTRPVIHITANVTARPNIFNLTAPTTNNSALCVNGTSVCSRITACFALTITGNFPSTVPITYNVTSDSANHITERRASFSQNSGKVKVVTNSTGCLSLDLRFKLPIRNQLTPVIVKLTYQVAGKRRSTASRAALLDALDVKPVQTEITFAKTCLSDVCRCDLKITSVEHEARKQVVLGKKRLIEFALNVSNNFDVAYDVHLDVIFNRGLYMIQVVPLSGDRCMNLAYGGLKVDEEHDTHEHSDESENFNLMSMVFSKPVMRSRVHCAFKLQFGTRWYFQGGDFDFGVNASSTSLEVRPDDNHYSKRLKVLFESKCKLRGTPKPDEIHFSSGKIRAKIRSLKDIGPEISHIYRFTNLGPASIPNATLTILWPSRTVSGHDILYLTNVTCTPKEACECSDAKRFVNRDRIGPRNWKGVPLNRGKGPIDLGERRNPKMNEMTSSNFYEIDANCATNEKMVCETLMCNLHKVKTSKPVSLHFGFRIWKQTFVEGQTWMASFTTKAVASTKNSPFITSSTGAELEDIVVETTSNAINEEFHEVHDHDSPVAGVSWWIYAVAIGGGLFFLFLVMLILYKVGFFKSKYQEKLQDEVQWGKTYKYTAANQPKFYNQNRNCSNNGQEMSTFQKHLSQSPAL